MADHYERLGITPAATAAEVKQAYLRLARDKHPDRFTDPLEKKRAEAEFQEITTAFNTLANPRSRQEYDAERAHPQPVTPEELASDAFARARPALEAGRLDEAVSLLRAAAHHAPGEARYHAALGRTLARVQGAAREAVQSLERATQLDPRDVSALADLATLLAALGLRIRAQKALQAAQKLAPGEPRLARLAAELEQP
jgi:curved DNA-binding protein CbpA